jgi:hypothetical protein
VGRLQFWRRGTSFHLIFPIYVCGVLGGVLKGNYKGETTSNFLFVEELCCTWRMGTRMCGFMEKFLT